jgi:hypothetical protein
MSKKLKLDLNDLKVTSFVTSLGDGQKKGIKGGATPLCGPVSEYECPTQYVGCPTFQTCETCDCGTETCNATCQGVSCDYWLCETYQSPDC